MLVLQAAQAMEALQANANQEQLQRQISKLEEMLRFRDHEVRCRCLLCPPCDRFE
jgi:hypothetical protein